MLGSLRRILTYNPQGRSQQGMTVQSLKIIPKSPSFFVDDYIEGQVEMTTTMQVIINDINLVLNCGQSWVTFSKELNTNINEKKTEAIVTTNMDVKRKLNINSNLVALQAGKYNFGFKFKILNEINPSFEFPGIDGTANLRYVLVANIISPYINGSATTYLILKKRQKIEMNKQVSFVAENNVHKWGIFDGGKTSLKITSVNGTTNFKYNEDVKFDINIDNTKGKMNTSECKVVLTRDVVFKNQYGQAKKTFNNELITTIVKTCTTPGENKSFPFSLSLKNIENKLFNIQGAGIPYSNVDNINYFLPTIKTSIIECSYMLKFTLYFDKFVKFNDRPRIKINIIICHQTMDEYKQEMNQKLNMNNNIINNNLINNNIPPPNMPTPEMMPPPNMPPLMNNNGIPNTPLCRRTITLRSYNANYPPEFHRINSINNNTPLSRRNMHMSMNNENLPQHFNQMDNNMDNHINDNNNMDNNINEQEEELPSMEEVLQNSINPAQKPMTDFNDYNFINEYNDNNNNTNHGNNNYDNNNNYNNSNSNNNFNSSNNNIINNNNYNNDNNNYNNNNNCNNNNNIINNHNIISNSNSNINDINENNEPPPPQNQYSDYSHNIINNENNNPPPPQNHYQEYPPNLNNYNNNK